MSHLNSHVIVTCYNAPPPPCGSRWSKFVLSSLEIDNLTSITQKDNSPGLLQVLNNIKVQYQQEIDKRILKGHFNKIN